MQFQKVSFDYETKSFQFYFSDFLGSSILIDNDNFTEKEKNKYMFSLSISDKTGFIRFVFNDHDNKMINAYKKLANKVGMAEDDFFN